jgi:hypothetical protein
VTQEERQRILKGLEDDVKCEQAMRLVQRRLNPVGWDSGLSAFDWASVAEWFWENWDEILRILLTILPLFLGDDNETT